jgi:hypothetical protein
MNFWEDVIIPSMKEGVDLESLKTQFDEFNTNQVSGLAASKEKILNEKKKLQAQFDEMSNKYGWLDTAELSKEKFDELQVELDSFRKNSQNPEDVKDREKSILEQGKLLKEKELNPRLEELDKQLEMIAHEKKQYMDRYKNYRVEKEVKDTLSEMGVEYDPLWLDGLMTRSKFEYNEHDDIMEIELWSTDAKSTIPITDWVKVFPGTTTGKKMIKAPQNFGGGARGGSGSNGPEAPEDAYDNMFNYK